MSSNKQNSMSKPNLLTRAEFGEAIFQKIKAEIESRGHSLWPKNFPPDYPVSRRVLYDIKRGHFKIETLNRLPGIEVREWFEIL